MNKVSGLQVVVLSLYLIATACHFLLVSAALAHTGSVRHPFVCLEVLAVLMTLLSWMRVMAVNPSLDAKQYCVSFLVRHLQVPSSRYCSVCAASTLGMDHHCLWLNCCIGRRNYASFLALSVSLVFQMLLQVTFCLYALVEGVINSNTAYLNVASIFSSANQYVLEILMALQLVFCAVILLYMVSLVLFHIYLINCRKSSTFEWVMRRRYKVSDLDIELRENSLRERQLQLEREEWQAKLVQNKFGSTITESSDTADTMP